MITTAVATDSHAYHLKPIEDDHILAVDGDGNEKFHFHTTLGPDSVPVRLRPPKWHQWHDFVRDSVTLLSRLGDDGLALELGPDITLRPTQWAEIVAYLLQDGGAMKRLEALFRTYLNPTVDGISDPEKAWEFIRINAEADWPCRMLSAVLQARDLVKKNAQSAMVSGLKLTIPQAFIDMPTKSMAGPTTTSTENQYSQQASF